MKKVSIIMLILFYCIFLSGCLSTSGKEIRLKGDFNTKVEIGTKFEDPGVIMPKGYNLKIDNYILVEILNYEFEIKYKIYSPEGELVKELTRYVKFVDTTGPSYEKTSIKYLMPGEEYGLSDFIADYSDNYDKKSDIIVTTDLPKSFGGVNSATIKIELKDSSGNITKYRETFEVRNDFEAMVEKWKNKGKIRFYNAESVGDYYRVEIDEKTNLSYYKNSNSFHMIKQVDSKLGSYASIQLSGTLGDYSRVSVNYHINQGSKYSVGFATIYGAKSYNVLNIDRFSSSINNLNLNESDMLEELNKYIKDFYNEFSSYKDHDWSSLYE